nr:hypothetical protein [uncultured Acetatifactor sp.]
MVNLPIPRMHPKKYTFCDRGGKEMAIELYPHNEEAYQKAMCMMQEHRSVAVVHPTSTGKSFIAFKLAEEHPGMPVKYVTEDGLRMGVWARNKAARRGSLQLGQTEAWRPSACAGVAVTTTGGMRSSGSWSSTTGSAGSWRCRRDTR